MMLAKHTFGSKKTRRGLKSLSYNALLSKSSAFYLFYLIKNTYFSFWYLSAASHARSKKDRSVLAISLFSIITPTNLPFSEDMATLSLKIVISTAMGNLS